MDDDEAAGGYGAEPSASGTDEDGGMGHVIQEEGPNGRGSGSFDPTPYLRQLRGRNGGQDYLDVKWRLLWLRREHPDAAIVTEHVQIDPTIAIFKATVSLPTGGKATGYGSETAGDFGDFIEKAETKAIGRALNALGYGAHFGDRGAEEADAVPARPTGSAVSAPPPSRQRPVAPAPGAPPREARSPEPGGGEPRPRPAAVAAPADDPDPPRPGAARTATAEPPPPAERPAARGAEPIDIAAGRDRAASARSADRPARGEASGSTERGRDAGAPPAAPATGTDGDAGPGADAELADYSWTAFWPWARGLGLNGPKAVEQLIGRPTAGLTPAELRGLILAARGED